MAQIGIITEQNDLGLNFNPLSKDDQKKYEENMNKNNNNNQSSSKDKK